MFSSRLFSFHGSGENVTGWGERIHEAILRSINGPISRFKRVRILAVFILNEFDSMCIYIYLFNVHLHMFIRLYIDSIVPIQSGT